MNVYDFAVYKYYLLGKVFGVASFNQMLEEVELPSYQRFQSPQRSVINILQYQDLAVDNAFLDFLGNPPES